MKKKNERLIGRVAVDSGQLLICDPSYIDNDEWIKWKKNRDASLRDPKDRGKFSYLGCCEATLRDNFGQLNFKAGHAGAGVVTSTGFGDGFYPVYATLGRKGSSEEGRVMEVRIDFS